MKKLSILICTIEKRKPYLDRLMERLQPQLNDDVEFLVKCDNGEITIGKKRNQLIQSCTGEYSCFIDDDDLVDIRYVAKILKAIEKKPDCVGMEGIITFDGKNPKKFIHSLKYKSWFEKRGVYYRCCNHLNAIKRELVLQVPFPEINNGEDHDFSMRILPLLKTEVYIDGPIYFYEFRSVKDV